MINNKYKRLILLIIATHIIIYICWSFVEISFTKPIIETFKTKGSRGCYLAFLFVCLFFLIPINEAIEEEKNENNAIK